MKCEREAEGAQRVTLLYSAAAADGVISEVQEGLTRIARFHPGGHVGKVAAEFFEHGFAVNIVECVRKVQEEGPALVVRVRRQQLGGGVDDSLTASTYTNTQL